MHVETILKEIGFKTPKIKLDTWKQILKVKLHDGQKQKQTKRSFLKIKH